MSCRLCAETLGAANPNLPFPQKASSAFCAPGLMNTHPSFSQLEQLFHLLWELESVTKAGRSCFLYLLHRNIFFLRACGYYVVILKTMQTKPALWGNLWSAFLALMQSNVCFLEVRACYNSWKEFLQCTCSHMLLWSTQKKYCYHHQTSPLIWIRFT